MEVWLLWICCEASIADVVRRSYAYDKQAHYEKRRSTIPFKHRKLYFLQLVEMTGTAINTNFNKNHTGDVSGRRLG